MGREIQLWILRRGLDGALAPTQCLCEEDPSVRKGVSAGAWARVPMEGGDAAGFGESRRLGAHCAGHLEPGSLGAAPLTLS